MEESRIRHEIMYPGLTQWGGCPIYTPETGILSFVDQVGPPNPILYQLDTKTNKLDKFQISGKEFCTSAVPSEKAGKYVLTCGREVAEFTCEKNELRSWAPFEQGVEIPTRSSEARADKTGRIWFGTMGTEWTEDQRSAVHTGMGSLYSIEADGSNLRKHDEKIDLALGIGFSQDNRTLFLADSGQRVIYAYNYDETTGELSNRRVAVDFRLVRIRIFMGAPAGFSIDTNGHIWVCCYGASTVACFDPETSALLDRVIAPSAHITSCAFGGPNMSSLYVTSRKCQLENSGGFFRIDGFQEKGIPSHRTK